MPSPADIAAFQGVVARIGGLAAAAAAALWRDPTTYSETVDPYLAAAGLVTAQWYHELAPQAAFAVQIAPHPASDILQASARGAAEQSDPVQALQRSTERRVFSMSRDTVALNARRENVKFARYASATACPWCRVLASRGAVYRTEKTATKGHDGCHCIAVPQRAGDIYQAPDYTAGWEREYKTARAAVGGNLDDIANYLRRQQI